MTPIGIFGGTFDPIHFGHLRTAFEMLQALRFGEIRFTPCGSPPHRGKTYASADLRMEMVKAAIEGQPGFVLDTRELDRDGPSYTVETLRSMREDFPSSPLGLIIGMDAFLTLPNWYRWQEILDLSHILVAHRPGWRAPDIGPLGKLLADHGTHRIDSIHENLAGHIFVHDVTQLEISSTDIRELVAAGRDPRFLTPEAVRNVISASECYSAL